MRRRVVVGGWLVVVVTAGLVARNRGLTPLDLVQRFGGLIADHWWGPLLFVVAYTLRPLVVFPGSALTVLAGVVFGPVWGTVWVIAGATASTAVTYGAGRYVGGDRAWSNAPDSVRRQVERAVDRPFVSTLVMRLVYLPFDAVGWLGGLVGLRFWPFMAASFIGTLPGIVSFVGFGASLEAVGADEPGIDIRLLAASAAVAVASIAVSRRLDRQAATPAAIIETSSP